MNNYNRYSSDTFSFGCRLEGGHKYKDKLYFADGDEISSTADCGESWERISLDSLLQRSPYRIKSLSDMIIEDDNFIALTVGGDIYLSEDQGASWVETYSIRDTTNFTLGLDNRLGRFNFIKLSDRVLVLDRESRVHYSMDNGKTWSVENTTGLVFDQGNFGFVQNPRIYTSSLVPRNIVVEDDIIYACFVINGVKKSEDKGRTWISLDEGNPNMRCEGIVSTGDELYTRNFHSGVWRYGMKSVEEPVETDRAQQLTIFPNPGRNFFQIEIPEKLSQSGLIQVFDQQGRMMLSKNDDIIYGAMPLRLVDVAAGIYAVLVTVGNQQYVGRVVVDN